MPEFNQGLTQGYGQLPQLAPHLTQQEASLQWTNLQDQLAYQYSNSLVMEC